MHDVYEVGQVLGEHAILEQGVDAMVRAVTKPISHPIQFMIQAMSTLLLRLEFLRDVWISMLNLIIGKLKPSVVHLIPKGNLVGKTCLITGGNSGIGLSIAKSMAGRGCNVFLTSRSREKGEAAAEEVRKNANGLIKETEFTDNKQEIRVLELDNTSFGSVRKLVDTVEAESNVKIHYLFLNAGFPGSASHDFTEDGHELTYQTNFLSSFLMTHLLLERRILAEDARIVLTTSTGQYGGRISNDFDSHSTKGKLEPGFHGPPYAKARLIKTNPSSRYANTKLMQVAFGRLLQKRFDSIPVTPEEKDAKIPRSMSAHAFTPGYCSTPIFGKTDRPSLFSDPLFWLLVVSTKIAVPVEEGAATGVWLALKDGIENGGYWDRCQRRLSNADRLSDATLEKLWQRWCTDADVKWL